MASRSESVFSYTDDDKPNYDILSRQNLPANSFGRLVLDKPPFPYRLMGTLSSIDVHKKQFGVLVKLEKSDPEELIRSLHDYYTKNDPEEEDEVESEVEEESKNEEKSVGEESKNEEKSVGEEESQGEEESGGEGKPEDEEKLKEEKKMGAEKVAERQYISKRCKDVMRSEIAIGNIYAAYIDELKKVVRVRVLQINRINMTSATAPLQLEVHVLDYGMITTISEGKLMMLHNFFAEGEYGTALALTCCLPDERLFDGAPFPRLENFKLGNKVEVYVLSDEEPCLAVLGSLGTSPNSLPNAIFSYGVDARHADSFNRVVNGFMSAEPEMHKGWTSNGLIRSVCWSLVTIASCEDLANIAVRDVFTSLRYLHLQYSINRAYKKEGFHQTMAIDPAKLYSGAPVIVFYNPLGSFIRGTVTRVNGDGCDVEALDIPDLNVCNVPLNHLFYPSSVLLNIPPQIFYVNLTKGVTPTDECCDVVQELLGDNSVAALKFSLDHECVQLVNGNNININDVIEGYLEEADNECIDDGDVDGKGGKTPDGEAPGGEGEAPDGEAQGEDQAVDDQGEDGSVSGLNTPDSDDVGLSF